MASNGSKRGPKLGKASRSRKEGAAGSLQKAALLAQAIEDAAARLSAAGAELAAHREHGRVTIEDGHSWICENLKN